MTLIKPIGADIWLIYECACGLRHEARVKETVFPGGILCSCGKELRLKPIERTILNHIYKDEAKPLYAEKNISKPTGAAQATNMAVQLSRGTIRG